MTIAASRLLIQKNRLDPSLELILKRIRLRAQIRIKWLRKLWSEEVNPTTKFVVTHTEIDSHLADVDAPAAELEWYVGNSEVKQLVRQLTAVEAKMADDQGSRFAEIHHLFKLDKWDSDVLQACVAMTLDPTIARIYAYLHDHAGRGYVTEGIVARLFGYGRCGFWKNESNLRKWQLVTEKEVAPGEPQLIACDPLIRNWLQGQNDLDEYLVGIARYYRQLSPLKNWPVEEMSNLIKDWIESEVRIPVRVRIVGMPSSGRRSLATAISSQLGYKLLAIEADQVEESNWLKAFVRAQRQAYLDGSALAWHGDTVLSRTWPQIVSYVPLQFVICESGSGLPSIPNVIDHQIEIPAVTLKERRKLWRNNLPTSKSWTQRAFDEVVEQHKVGIGDITAAAQKKIKSASEAVELVRNTARERLGKLTQLLECPFTWDDLVLSDKVLEELKDFVFEAKERVAFWERPEARRLFPQGRGLLALFTGTPGTGKTMAAQVIAASLGLDLFRIDLSAVVSKYVGETSQNLERILSRAAQMDVVLLADECDALFGKRTNIVDAHDRFANTDTNYLLQAIENYQGIILLATNKKSNIDSAFIRRLRYVLDFPKPDAAQRMSIWQKVVGELAGRRRLKILNDELKTLATAVEITGAQIKYVVLTAMFVARRDRDALAMKHLIRGLERELMKEGRALGVREREKLLKHG